jgi:hypothetical protein
MQLIFDEQTLRQLIPPIVAEIIANIVEAERRDRSQSASTGGGFVKEDAILVLRVQEFPSN